MCTAYNQGRLCPTYVWIFQNLKVEDFLQDTQGCATVTMQEALENSILLQAEMAETRPFLLLFGHENKGSTGTYMSVHYQASRLHA